MSFCKDCKNLTNKKVRRSLIHKDELIESFPHCSKNYTTCQSVICNIFSLDSCRQDEVESEGKISNETSEESSLDKVLYSETHQETEVERLVRLGEMTPFGSTITKQDDMDGDGITGINQIKNTSIDAPIGGDHDLVDVGHSATTRPVTTTIKNLASPGDEDVPVVDSDEDYIPDDEELKLSFKDDEHFMPEDIEPVDDVTITTTKTNKAKKSKRLYQSIKDDGDDRTYQIRIRYDILY
jgi:hypothetical protein